MNTIKQETVGLLFFDSTPAPLEWREEVKRRDDVTDEQIDSYLQGFMNGSVRCEGVTIRGRRCKNVTLIPFEERINWHNFRKRQHFCSCHSSMEEPLFKLAWEAMHEVY